MGETVMRHLAIESLPPSSSSSGTQKKANMHVSPSGYE